MRLIAIPLLAFALSAATPPPPKVDRALRARATQFEQFQVEGNFRKAYDLVADDSKDFYFSASKEKQSAFTIEGIDYKDNFTKASVRVSVMRRMMVGARPIELPTVLFEQWKLQGGKWMWYHDANLEKSWLFGPEVPKDPASKTAPVKPYKPPSDTSPEAVASAAQSALKAAPDKPALDKDSFTFIQGKAETQELTFRNTYPGQIRLYATTSGGLGGVTVEPAESTLDAAAEVTVKIHYQPNDWVLQGATLTLEVQPFRKSVTLPITFKPVPAPLP